MTIQIKDKLGRPIRDLRTSVTDRCNFRCDYCMPEEVFGDGSVFLPKEELLTFDEITTIAKVYAELGAKKSGITGGEPLSRRNSYELVERLNRIGGIKDIGTATNGLLLKKRGQKLYSAGLHRINVNLDAIDDEVFQAISNRNIKASTTLQQINYAVSIGFHIKVSVAIQKRINDDQTLPMTEYFKDRHTRIRFIEFMDIGNDNGWDLNKVVTKEEMLSTIEGEFDIEPLPPRYFGEVAIYYRYKDNGAQFGLITSVPASLCSIYTRERLSSDGKFYGCLFSIIDGFDIKSLPYSGAIHQKLKSASISLWQARGDRYSDERTEQTVKNRQREKINMSYIGS